MKKRMTSLFLALALCLGLLPVTALAAEGDTVYVGGVALSVLLCLLGGYALQGMTRTILLFPVFMASWLPLQVISLFKDTRKWHAITHSGRAPVVGYRAQ